ncbi:sterol-sensing domain of SREBP cleavage-activation-domain-containing protein [Schizophyllum amplum]|uniref:Sterol regulatory element-binding protein cleavage-activating protein n=1 Tax=Schizophyllum amplum TaxID=97359 RepID=A0A550C517_9AGAR|nr:sterol-sensing domain of SREBP cleavage-activation-domain-containing protein [Auriculariopsis ampla]
MLGYTQQSLQFVRRYCEGLFLRFGRHCATHQIRLILISGIVITSLCYPALAIYTSSVPKSVSILDTFAGTSAVKDLHNLWSAHNTLRVQEDAVSRARCGVGRVLRQERVLIESPLDDDDGAVNHQILFSTLNLERRIEDLLTERGVKCLTRPDGHCLMLSPLAFWDHDLRTLISDSSILDTLSLTKNVSVAGIPLTPQMVTAGRSSPDGSSTSFDFARFLVLTYFFPETDCLSTANHLSWLDLVSSASSDNAKLSIQVQDPSIVALEYDPALSQSRGLSALSAFLYLAYTGFFAYITICMRRMTGVHSRLGLTFTAIVEITVSTITSLSVCALVGFKITMVPWEILPVMIVFVGAEHMINLVYAVTRTPITVSVKERVAMGLSVAGTSNTLKVVSYNAILGVIAVFSAGAIRQFCTFAVVVLVAHWFLAHTFFLTVLSIDIQRLELDELLRQNTRLGPAIPKREKTVGHPDSFMNKTALAFKSLSKGRATKNLSLFMLLGITATLYYATTPTCDLGLSGNPTASGALTRSRLNATAFDHSTHDAPAKQIWKLLNPTEVAPLHIVAQAPARVTFIPEASRTAEEHRHHIRLGFSTRTFRFFAWFLRAIVFPISATTTGLYGLLLYLLKNAELLESQRHRPETNSPTAKDETKSLEGELTFATHARAFTSDIELLAASASGHVVAAVGLQNEVTIWRTSATGRRSHVSIDLASVLAKSASSSHASGVITSIAVDAPGTLCAVGTGEGVVAVYQVLQGSVRPLATVDVENTSAGVVDMQFVGTAPPERPAPYRTPPSSRPVTPVPQAVESVLAVAYESGLVARWTVCAAPRATFVVPGRAAGLVKTWLVRVGGEGERLLAAFAQEDGRLELLDLSEGGEPLVQPELCLHPGSAVDRVAQVHVGAVTLEGETRVVVAAATEAGVVSLWDGRTGDIVAVLDEAHGAISRIRVSPAKCEACWRCGHRPLESFVVALSTGQTVRFFQAYLSDEQTQRCSCARARQMPSSLGRRSRSSSFAGTTPSPVLGRKRAMPLPASDAAPFPVSGHGVHSRRASEKEASSRRLPDSLGVPTREEETLLDARPASAFWQRAFVVAAAEAPCAQGSWEQCARGVFGVRRRPRALGQAPPVPGLSSSSWGLTNTVLERWEVWRFEPATGEVRCSPLAALFDSASVPDEGDLVPRMPFTRVYPLLLGGTRGFAGFGNTVGVFEFAER